MQTTRRWFAAALAAGLVLGAGQAGWASPASPGGSPGAAPAPRTQAQPVTVTLLTGDRVTVTGAGAEHYAVRPGPGREHIQFLANRERDALYVIPQDAQRLVRSGKLDRRLFDVAGLVRSGYHDAARGSLPLIVTYQAGAGRRAAGPSGVSGVRVTRELPAIGGAAVAAAKGEAAAFWASIAGAGQGARASAGGGFDKIWLDGKRQISLDSSVPQIGAPAAHQAGFTGRGVTVAVLDTGVDSQHPDLVGKVAEARNFSEAPDSADIIGHGTHVASTIAGSGAASGGKYRGVAPDATLVSGKVCESYGCTESAILAGMQWAAVDKRANVINLSLGGTDGPEIDPLEEAVNTLTAQTGTLFVIAAGNEGDDRTVGSPGSAEAALTVGAVDRNDELAYFSSRGPRVGDDGIKPDLTAPGVEIVAARAAGTDMAEPVGDHYMSASGTSMATPHVAGAAALLAQQHPGWTAERLKATLVASAKPNPGLTAYQQGAGRVDVARAITQSVTTDPVAVSFGRTGWPHADDEPVTRTVTYRNSGAAAVTLNLALQVTGPGNAALPAGMFQASATTVTVPAGGTAQVSVTADTSVESPDGYWTGRLLATAGSTSVVTAIAVHKEVESYDLTLIHKDATGAAATDYVAFVVGLDEWRYVSTTDETGTVTVRLPKGRYGLTSWVWSSHDERTDIAMLAQPELRLTRDTTVTLDARQTSPVVMTVPDKSAVPALVDVGHTFYTADGISGFDVLADSFAEVTVGQLGPAVSPDEFVSMVASQWGKPDAEGRFDNSPYLYSLMEVVPGRMPTGFVRHYRNRDLATVRHDFRGVAPGGSAVRFVYPEHDLNIGGWSIVLPIAMPGQRVEHYNTNGVRWRSDLWMGSPDEDGWLELQAGLTTPATRYQAGRQYRDVWNEAPLGPGFPNFGAWIVRNGDLLLANASMFSDVAGHAGFSRTDTGRTALYRNGELVDETDYDGYGEFAVPSGSASYRLETSATRSNSDLSTRVEAAWTFQSGHANGDNWISLPVAAVRFAPKLDSGNAAAANRSFDIPVTVEYQQGVSGLRVKQLTVEVSYDDGQTWRAASVRAGKQGWVATVKHPKGAGYASLRAKATDTGGNTVTQSIIHAYKLK